MPGSKFAADDGPALAAAVSLFISSDDEHMLGTETEKEEFRMLSLFKFKQPLSLLFEVEKSGCG